MVTPDELLAWSFSTFASMVAVGFALAGLLALLLWARGDRS